MTATLPPTFERVDTEAVTTILSLVHDQWMERIARVLVPAAVPRAGFWDRWGAARFLADQFEDRFRLECELVESMGDTLPPSIRLRLRGAREALERARADLMAAGRRWGADDQVALLARRFLDQTRRWCATLEMATLGLGPEDLPEASRVLLARARTASGLAL